MCDRNRGSAALRARREQRELSQYGLAVALGIHPQMVSMMERGLRKPGRVLAMRLRDEYGIAIEWWDEPEPAGNESAAENPPISSD